MTAWPHERRQGIEICTKSWKINIFVEIKIYVSITSKLLLLINTFSKHTVIILWSVLIMAIEINGGARQEEDPGICRRAT